MRKKKRREKDKKSNNQREKRTKFYPTWKTLKKEWKKGSNLSKWETNAIRRLKNRRVCMIALTRAIMNKKFPFLKKGRKDWQKFAIFTNQSTKTNSNSMRRSSFSLKGKKSKWDKGNEKWMTLDLNHIIPITKVTSISNLPNSLKTWNKIPLTSNHKKWDNFQIMFVIISSRKSVLRNGHKSRSWLKRKKRRNKAGNKGKSS